MKGYRDIQGDGGSQVLEQVAALRRRIEERLRGVRRVLAVGSGKGGVGKSTLANLLARVETAEGARVAILDADLNGPSQARLSGLGEAPLVPGAEGLLIPRTEFGLGVVSLGSVLRPSQALQFDSVSRGDSHVWRSTREFAFLGQLLASVHWGELDLLVVDLPPGSERTAQFAEFFEGRAAFVLVSLPSALSREVVARSVTSLREAGVEPLGWVENMSAYACEGCGELRPLFPSGPSVEVGVPRLGAVPFDPEWARAAETGSASRSLPDGPAAAAAAEVAAAIRSAMEGWR